MAETSWRLLWSAAVCGTLQGGGPRQSQQWWCQREGGHTAERPSKENSLQSAKVCTEMNSSKIQRNGEVHVCFKNIACFSTSLYHITSSIINQGQVFSCRFWGLFCKKNGHYIIRDPSLYLMVFFGSLLLLLFFVFVLLLLFLLFFFSSRGHQWGYKEPQQVVETHSLCDAPQQPVQRLENNKSSHNSSYIGYIMGKSTQAIQDKIGIICTYTLLKM